MNPKNEGSSRTIRSRARRPLLLLAGLLSLVGILPATAQALVPTIENGGAQMFEQTVTARENGNSANRLEINAVVKHDVGKKVTGFKVDTDYNATDNSATAATIPADLVEQPTVVGGFNYTTAFLSFNNTVSNIACGDRPGFSHTIYIRPVLSDGTVGNVSSASIFFTPAGGCSLYEDYPYMFGQSNTSPVQIVPGGTATFSFTADDPDTGNNTQGYAYRFRRLNDGATTGLTVVCPTNIDNVQQTRTYTFPNQRGHWVVEAELREGSGCTDQVSLAGKFWRIGSADVNTAQAASPALSLSRDTARPQINGNVTITATTDDADDSANGGAVQYIEWDFTNDGTYDDATLGSGALTGAGDDSDALTAGEKQTTINTTGKAPGTYTVKGRVTDNGANNASDNIRRQTSATTTYTVDSRPVAASQTVATETGQPKPITLTATDADNDGLTYSIVSGPSQGTLSGAGSTQTYTSAAGFAGTDSFVFQANDGFGGTSNGTVTISVAPQTQIDSGPNGTTGPDASFAFSSPVAGAAFECSLDGAAFASCASPKGYTGLASGQHTFQVRAVAAGLTDPTPASRTFTTDATPPETTIDSGPTGPTVDSTPEFTFSSSEAGSTFQCRTDAGSFQSCASPHETQDLAPGTHTFEVRATDQYGNVDPTPASRTVVILNASDPETTINSGPSGRTTDPSPTFTFSSSIVGSTFDCRLDGGAFRACTSPDTIGPLDDGQHTFEVRAVSPAGNEDPTPASRIFTVDTIAPDTTITSGPAGFTNDSTPTFAFTSDEAGSTFECRVDNGTFAACSSPHTTAPLSDGGHTIEVRAVDAVGHADETPASRTFWVDTVVPETTIDSGPSGLTNDNTPTFGFSSDEATSTFQCRVDGGAFTSCTSPKTTAQLADGQHTFEVRATDPAGNQDGSPASSSFRVDTAAPQTTIDQGPSGPTNDSTPTFAFSSSEANSTFECRVDDAAFTGCTSPTTTAQLADGQHTFEVRATDPAGNLDGSPAARTFRVDTAAPETTIDSGPSGLTNDNTPTFGFSSDEANSTFQCRLDSGAFTTCDSQKTFDTLADGQHTFEVRAIDAAGNVDGTPAQRTFRVDATNPQTTIDQGPGGLTNDRTPTFDFSSDEPNATFECRVDGGSFSPCTSPFTTLSLNDGQHAFEVRATDEAGNVDQSPASRTFTVDATNPQTTITGGPSGLTNDDTPTFSFTSDEANSTFQCRVDSGAFANCTSPQTTAQLADGQHTFEVRATDPAGNTDPSPAAQTFTVDATKPETTITGGPNGLTSNRAPTFSFTSDEANSTFQCRVDSGAFANCTSPQTTAQLADGQHTFEVRATDPAGNTDPSPASRTFTVDATAPSTTIDGGPSQGERTKNTTPTFTFSSNESGATFECRIDDAAFTSCDSPLTTAELAEGNHTFEVRATDRAGNVDASPASRDFTVDTTAPETTIDDGPGQITHDDTPTFRFHSSEANSTFECRIDGGAFTGCGSPFTATTLSDGPHTFEVRATDAAANTDGTPASRDFRVDTTAPGTTIDSGPGLTSDNTPSFEFSSNDSNATFECRIDGAAFASCTSPYTTNQLADGQHTLQVRATDQAGNTEDPPASRTFTVDTTPPQTTIDGGPSGPTNDSTPSFTFSSSEPGSTFECRIDGGAFGDCDSPSAAPSLSDGSHTFEVRATDPARNTDASPASRTFTVDTADPQTTIDSGPDGPTNDPTPTFGFSSSEPGSTFECRIDSGAFAPCSSAHTTAQLADGQHTFEVRATDPAGNVDETPAAREFTVDTDDPDTTIDSGPSGLTNDPRPTFELSSDEPNATFECRIDGGSFAGCESPYRTDHLSDGGHTLQARAIDSAGNADQTPASRTFTVDATAPSTTIDQGPGNLTNDTTPTFGFSSSEPSSTFECRIDGDAFAACDSPYTAVPLADGEHTFAVRATDQAGNVESSPASRTFEVDATEPQTTIDSGPDGPTNDQRPPFAFSSSEPGSTFECRIDGGAFAACATPYRPSSNLSDGNHTFEVRATDGAGNRDATSATRSFRVDTSAPTTNITFGPSSRTPDDTPTFQFASNDVDARFQCRVDSDAAADYVDCDSPYTLDRLSGGAHRFDVRAVDRAGNADATPASRTFTVAQPPNTSIDSGPSGPTNDSTPTFGFSSSGPDPTFECRLDSDDPAGFAPCDSPYTTSELPDGSHTLDVRASDSAGTDRSPASRTFRVDTAEPDTTITSAPPASTRDNTPTFNFVSSEEGSTFRCRLDADAFTRCERPFTAPELAPGKHTFAVHARDAAGNLDGSPATRTFTVEEPSNRFSFEGVKRNERKGTARLRVKVPGAGQLELRGRSVEGASKEASRRGVSRLKVVAKGRAARQLAKRGRVRVRVRVTFTPEGGTPRTKRKTVRLLLRA